MNGYKTRPSHEHYNHSSESTSPMATCYESTATAEISYPSSGSYNVLQPFHSYPPSYFEPQASMSLQHPEMQTIPPLRHDQQQHHFGSQHSLRHPGYMGQSGFPPDTSPSRFVTSMYGAADNDVESQDSINEATTLSEPIIPPVEGFPLVEDFDKLMESYVNDLSVKKQDKALINARRARNIRSVLTNPKDTNVGSAQFRFWVKKMFKLEPADGRFHVARQWICHEGKPVAIREKLFKILTRAHQQCQHGGRDKTSAQVRQVYSWVPKELISRFVKICPTCQVRRGGSHLSPPDSRRNSPPVELARAQQQQQQPAGAASTYMRAHQAQPASPTAYDDYRRNSTSSSSLGYTDRNIEPLPWAAYSSAGSRQNEMAWNAAPHQQQQQQHHHHHSSRQHTQHSFSSRVDSSHYASNHKRASKLHMDASSPPSPASESPHSHSQAPQYGYIQASAHGNTSRYTRPGY